MFKIKIQSLLILFLMMSVFTHCGGGTSEADSLEASNSSNDSLSESSLNPAEIPALIAGYYYSVYSDKSYEGGTKLYSYKNYEVFIGKNGLFHICSNNYESFSTPLVIKALSNLDSYHDSSTSLKCVVGQYELVSQAVYSDVVEVQAKFTPQHVLKSANKCASSASLEAELGITSISFEIYPLVTGDIDEVYINIQTSSGVGEFRDSKWKEIISYTQFVQELFLHGLKFNYHEGTLDKFAEHYCTNKDITQNYDYPASDLSGFKQGTLRHKNGQYNYFWVKRLTLNQNDEIVFNGFDATSAQLILESGPSKEYDYYSDISIQYNGNYETLDIISLEGEWSLKHEEERFSPQPYHSYSSMFVPLSGTYALFVYNEDFAYDPNTPADPMSLEEMLASDGVDVEPFLSVGRFLGN